MSWFSTKIHGIDVQSIPGPQPFSNIGKLKSSDFCIMFQGSAEWAQPLNPVAPASSGWGVAAPSRECLAGNTNDRLHL